MSDATLIAELRARIDNLESQAAIRGVMAEYLRLCDKLDASTPMDELASLFTPDAVWVGAGARYGAAFGGHHGRSAIVAMFEAYRTPPHFAFNAHFLTSETIAVADDSAQGRWMMLQTSTYSSGSSDLRSAKLTVDFARTQAKWQISRFETENLFSRAIDRWDDPLPVPVPQTQPRGA
ncbi:MAG TPA: nuclear transport factor 2 family protein [Steroidobacteraceae bacterium]|nr:nuclear transport factor 2 family protein [Steroidobacteraceae bacterium]